MSEPVPTPLIKRKCPICGKPSIEANRPFCSKRCADIDLSRWLKGVYAIPGDDGDEAERDDLSNQERE